MYSSSNMLDSHSYRTDEQVTKIPNGGLFNRQKCQNLTKQIFQIYGEKDVNDNYHELNTITAGKMLMDLYRSMNKNFHPTATDIASFARIFDRDNKGKMSFDDIFNFTMKYYCNED